MNHIVSDGSDELPGSCGFEYIKEQDGMSFVSYASRGDCLVAVSRFCLQVFAF